MSPRSPKGELISDRYRIEDRLGSGGMSSVFRATDTILERTVAVKILAEHLSDDDILDVIEYLRSIHVTGTKAAQLGGAGK